MFSSEFASCSSLAPIHKRAHKRLEYSPLPPDRETDCCCSVVQSVSLEEAAERIVCCYSSLNAQALWEKTTTTSVDSPHKRGSTVQREEAAVRSVDSFHTRSLSLKQEEAAVWSGDYPYTRGTPVYWEEAAERSVDSFHTRGLSLKQEEAAVWSVDSPHT